MLNALIPYLLKLKLRFPGLYARLVSLGKRYLGSYMGIYPRPLANEIRAVSEVIRGSQWNMAYGKGLVHERLEADFAEYVGVRHAIAVNTGGMALQMSMRALGLKPGHEIILQADTCAATAFAVLNAGCTPIFSEISEKTFMLSEQYVRNLINSHTGAVIATHMWGNPEDMASINSVAAEHNIFVIEDACLSLGAIAQGKNAGASGHVGVFSFGCVKPIQGGEGGMIVTNDEALARELRSLRHWGDRTIEFGVRDTIQLSWNGRMSEIIAAVVHEQLKGYPQHLSRLREAVFEFQRYITQVDGVEIALGASSDIHHPAFTQIVLRIEEKVLGWGKKAFMDELYSRGIQTWHANFEPINTLTFFRDDKWLGWVHKGDTARISANYHETFPTVEKVYQSQGMGLGKINFLSASNLRYLRKQIDILISKKPS